MDVIFNDFSLDGQFASIEEFEEYFVKTFYLLLHAIVSRKIPFYKKTDTYLRRLTKDETLLNYLHRSNRPVAGIIKKMMYQIACEKPYWDEDVQTGLENVYEYPEKSEEPNCFTEAIERTCCLISFPHQNYGEETISCSKNGKIVVLHNFTKKELFLTEYLCEKPEMIKNVMEDYTYPFDKKVVLGKVSDRCYAEEALLNNGLEVQDLLKILQNVPRLIMDRSQGVKSHWWDTVEEDICEYRISISSNREFRLFFLWKKDLIFLNGFIKKTGKTPVPERRKAREIASKLSFSSGGPAAGRW